MRLELGVDLCQEHLKLRGDLVTPFGAGQGCTGLGGHVKQRQRLRQPYTGNA
ncbi:hypothetical protein D3C79_1038020 [compost metagenome]